MQIYSRLKDEFGVRTIRLRGASKIMAHLMFDVLAQTVDQVLKLTGQPKRIRPKMVTASEKPIWLSRRLPAIEPPAWPFTHLAILPLDTPSFASSLLRLARRFANGSQILKIFPGALDSTA